MDFTGRLPDKLYLSGHLSHLGKLQVTSVDNFQALPVQHYDNT